MPAFQDPEYKFSQASKNKGFKGAFLAIIDGLFGVKKSVGARVPETKKNIEEYIKEIGNFLSAESFQDQRAAQLKPYIKKCDDCSALIMSLSEDINLLNTFSDIDNSRNFNNTQLNQLKQLIDYSEKISLYRCLLMLNAVSRFLKQELEKKFSDISNINSVENCEILIESASLDLNVFNEELNELSQFEKQLLNKGIKEEDRIRFQQLQEKFKALQKASYEFHLQVGRYFQVIGYHDLALQEFSKIKIESTEKSTKDVTEQSISKDEEDNSESVEIQPAKETTMPPPNTCETLKMHKNYSVAMLKLNSLPSDSDYPPIEKGKELIAIKSVLVECKEDKYALPPALENNIELTINYINRKVVKIAVKLQVEHRYNEIENSLKALNYVATLPEERQVELLKKKEAILKQSQKKSQEEEKKLQKVTGEIATLRETIKQQLQREIELLKCRLKEIREKLIILEDQCNKLKHDKHDTIKNKIELVDTNLKYLNDVDKSTSGTIAPQLIKSVESFLEKKYALQYAWEDLTKDYDLIENDLQNYNWTETNIEDINSKHDKLIDLKNKFSEILRTTSFSKFFKQHGEYRLNGIELLLEVIIFNKNILQLEGKQIETNEFSNQLDAFVQLRDKIQNAKFTRLTHVTLLMPSQATTSEETVSIKIKPQTITISTTMTQSSITLSSNGELKQESTDQFQPFPKHQSQKNIFWKFFDSLNCLKRSKHASTSDNEQESPKVVHDATLAGQCSRI